MMCLLAAPWVQLSISAGNGWPHNALRHHWLMPISCHFWDYKALLVTSLIHLSGAITSVQTFIFTFICFFNLFISFIYLFYFIYLIICNCTLWMLLPSHQVIPLGQNLTVPPEKFLLQNATSQTSDRGTATLNGVFFCYFVVIKRTKNICVRCLDARSSDGAVQSHEDQQLYSGIDLI